MKKEVCSGISEETLKKISKEKDWLYSGKYAVVHLVNNNS